MTREQVAEIRTELGSTNPATPEAVRDFLSAIRRPDTDRTMRLVRLVAPTVVQRLLDAEAERAALRSTVARLVVANNRGDDYSLSDLAFELERGGIDLKDDYDEADALAQATEQEAL